VTPRKLSCVRRQLQTMFRTKGKRPKGFERPKDYMPLPSTDHLLLADQPFWQALPDILQAQVLVMLDNGKRTKGKGWRVPAGQQETLLWAGTPHIRTRTLIKIFMIWSLLLVIPAVVLVEAVPDEGGLYSLFWAFVSIFIFVPYVSRGSREVRSLSRRTRLAKPPGAHSMCMHMCMHAPVLPQVYALTTHRAFSSCRTMFCSIQTAQVAYIDVASVKLSLHDDHTGSLKLRSKYADQIEVMTLQPQHAEHMSKAEVHFEHVFDVKVACKVLDTMLPSEVVEAAGLAGASGK
tara:strand:+ start:2897 stop:3769 length:873 start_codon:yes stop_codon:yes gene_type:complete